MCVHIFKCVFMCETRGESEGEEGDEGDKSILLWINYMRADILSGNVSQHECTTICV